MNTNGSVASSNSSASSLTAFNFDDSGVGTEDQTTATTMLALDSGTSPPFYAPTHPQHAHQIPPHHFNNIYQQHIYQQHMPDENTIGNNNGPVFKDLDGSSKELLHLLGSMSFPNFLPLVPLLKSAYEFMIVSGSRRLLLSCPFRFLVFMTKWTKTCFRVSHAPNTN